MMDGRAVHPWEAGLSFLVERISVWLDTSLLMSSFVGQTFPVYVRLETGSRLLSRVKTTTGIMSDTD